MKQSPGLEIHSLLHVAPIEGCHRQVCLGPLSQRTKWTFSPIELPLYANILPRVHFMGKQQRKYWMKIKWNKALKLIQAKEENYSKVYEFPALVFQQERQRAPWAGEESHGQSRYSQTQAHKNLVPRNPARHLFPMASLARARTLSSIFGTWHFLTRDV